jgi:hypothetical protein
LDLAVVVSFALLQELLGRALIMFQALHLADKPDFFTSLGETAATDL